MLWNLLLLASLLLIITSILKRRYSVVITLVLLSGIAFLAEFLYYFANGSFNWLIIKIAVIASVVLGLVSDIINWMGKWVKR